VVDYTPVYIQGQVITETASTAVLGRDLLEVTGSGTVGTVVPGATPSVKVVGVAAEDAASGARVTFFCRGPVHESIADGVITAGDLLVSATTAARSVRTVAVPGGVFTVGDETATRAVLGVALTTSADAGKVRWMLF
jgi:hypothetical protein